MKYKILLSILMSGLSLSAMAATDMDEYRQQKSSLARTLAAPINVLSGINPPEEKYGTYVLDTQLNPNSYCAYRRYQFDLYIPPLVNDYVLNSNQQIDNQYLNNMVSNNIISPQAEIRLPVFDIDSHGGSSNIKPEVDRLSLNGKQIALLAGHNNQWTEDPITVPITEIKFGQNNTFTVDVDIDNNEQMWCMSVDWISIKFDIMPPVALLHGIDAQASTWDESTAPGVRSTLDELGIKYQAFNAQEHGSAKTNGTLLAQQIGNFLKPMQAENVHLIAHSKGGLDAKYSISQSNQYDFKALSLSTISTPHLGSVAADIRQLEELYTARWYRNEADNDPGYATSFIYLPNFGPQPPGLFDLTTFSALYIQQKLPPNIPMFSVGANADKNHNDQLESDESNGLFPLLIHFAAKISWQTLRYYSDIKFVKQIKQPVQGSPTPYTVTIYDAPPLSTLRANDIVITTESATPSFTQSLGIYSANHSTIKNSTIINKIISRIAAIRGEQ